MSDDTIMRYDLEQPSHHMGSASMQPEPGFGGWIKYDDHAACIEALTAERDALAEKLAMAVGQLSICREMQAQVAHPTDPLMVQIDATLAAIKEVGA